MFGDNFCSWRPRFASNVFGNECRGSKCCTPLTGFLFFSVNDSIQHWLKVIPGCFFPKLALPPTLLCVLERQVCTVVPQYCHPGLQWPVASQCLHCDLVLTAGYVQPSPYTKSVGVWVHT